MRWSGIPSQKTQTRRPPKKNWVALAHIIMTLVLWIATLPKRTRLLSAPITEMDEPLLARPCPGSSGRPPSAPPVWTGESMRAIPQCMPPHARSTPARVSAPDDFTARVMARLESPSVVSDAVSNIQSIPAVPAPHAPRAQTLHAAPMPHGRPRSGHRRGIMFTVVTLFVLLLFVGIAVVTLVPALPFAVLSLLVSGCIIVLLWLRMLLNVLNVATANSADLLLGLAVVAGGLALWSRRSRWRQRMRVARHSES